MHLSRTHSPGFTHVVVENHATAIKPYTSPEVLRFAQDDSSLKMYAAYRASVPSARLRTCQRLPNRNRYAAPAFGFCLQLPSSRFGKTVIFGAPVIF